VREETYGVTIEAALSIEEAEERVRAALAAEGFGVLTEIDVQATLREKLGIERTPYRILGACNPTLANGALGVDERIGLLLPCNVIIDEAEAGTVVISVLDPAVMSSISGDPALEPIVSEARTRLVRALAEVEGR
jgi:uncharacterized protein (DUF302 family)